MSAPPVSSEARAVAEVSTPVQTPSRRSRRFLRPCRHESERSLVAGRGRLVFHNGLRKRRQVRLYSLFANPFYGSLWYRAAAWYALERAEGVAPGWLLVRPE